MNKKIFSLNKIKFLSNSKKKFINIDKDTFFNLVNLCTGLYKPLRNFCNYSEFKLITKKNELKSGQKWTMPILLSVKNKIQLKRNEFYIIKYKEKIVGCVKFFEYFQINKKQFSRDVFHTNSYKHPGVKKIYSNKNYFIDGECFLLDKAIPRNKYFLKTLKLLSGHNKNILKSSVGFSTRNICHRGHEFIQDHLNKNFKNLFVIVIQSSANKYNPGLIFKSYEYLNKFKSRKNEIKIITIYLPLFFAGPREAFFQSKIISNIGIKRLLVGRDHAGVKNFYGKYDSQNIFSKLKGHNQKIVKVKEPLLCLKCHSIKFKDKNNLCKICKSKTKFVGINGVNVRKSLLRNNKSIIRLFLNNNLINFFNKNRGLIYK